ncbi:MAG: hypothetical protein AAGI89_14905 [Pseudomonadota bacterium]
MKRTVSYLAHSIIVISILIAAAIVVVPTSAVIWLVWKDAADRQRLDDAVDIFAEHRDIITSLPDRLIMEPGSLDGFHRQNIEPNSPNTDLFHSLVQTLGAVSLSAEADDQGTVIFIHLTTQANGLLTNSHWGGFIFQRSGEIILEADELDSHAQRVFDECGAEAQKWYFTPRQTTTVYCRLTDRWFAFEFRT